MPNIYSSGEYVSEVGSAVTGGTTVVLHRPEEVPSLLKFIDRAAQPPESPLTSLYRAFTTARADLMEWLDYFSAMPSHSGDEESPFPLSSYAPRAEPRMKMLDSDLVALQEAIRMAHDLWWSSPEKGEMTLVVAIASEKRKPLHVDGDRVTFAIFKGSLFATVAKLPLTATIFFVGLVSGEGATPSARVHGLVRRLRERAQTEQHLPDISKGEFSSNGKPVVVLVHGLFDTDKGLFQNLENRLRKEFNVVGFPHDTLLTSVKTNGFDLAQILATLPGQPDVSLVCHSRGGLVARSAIQQLKKAERQPVKACVTFGTPHAGSPIAETPGQLIAAIATAKMALKTFSGATILDMMSAATLLGDLQGITDLRPPLKGKTFIEDLREDEGTFFDEQIPYMVIGGDCKPDRISEYVSSRLLGREPNDLVVLPESSVPRMKGMRRETTTCNHYLYFQQNQNGYHEKVVEFLIDPGKNP